MIPVVIIGAGPAGIAAAIQLQRSGIEFRLLEKNKIGGLLNEANLVENFPGIPNGVPGRILTARLRRQLGTAGIKLEKSNVLRLGYHDDCFVIQTEKQVISAGKVILACGTIPLPPSPPLDIFQPQNRVFNSVLPLLKARQKTIAVIGGGDSAFDYALNLAPKNKIHIVNRSGKLRALPLLLSRCRQHPNIIIHENTRLTSAMNKEGAAEIILNTINARNGRKNKIICQLILSAIGRMPALQFLAPDVLATITELASQKKIFLAGDVSHGRFRQAAIASAAGLQAAMEIHAGEIE